MELLYKFLTLILYAWAAMTVGGLLLLGYWSVRIWLDKRYIVEHDD